MAKLTLSDVSNITGNPTSAATTINNNSALIETALENTLSRDGTSPNEMNADLDMNSNRILNLPAPSSDTEPVRLIDVSEGVTVTPGDVTAEDVEFTPAGTIAATDVQAALEELDTDIQGIVEVSDGDKGDIVVSSTGTVWTVDPVTGTGNFVKATSPTLTTPNLGTPSSLTLTNATGLPTAGISDLGSGVATFLTTPSSSNLRLAVTGETGSGGGVVFATSPTLTTPNLGTPSAVTLTNATGLPVATGISGLGTGVATALAVNVGSAGAPVVNGGALGTPSSGTLTNATGLPISTGVSGLGTGVATFLATPSSANLASAVTGETGSGALVFGTSPTLTTPVLGTPSSGTLTNCTGLPISTGVSGLAANVATFLATPSSANLASAMTDELGTGNLLYGVSATSWTPAITFGGGAVGLTYSSRIGFYARMGSFIYAIFDIRLSAVGSSTGTAAITGLPGNIFAINGQGTITFYSGMASITGALTLSGSTGNSIIDFVQIGGATGTALATHANFTNSTIIVGWIGFFI